VTRQSLGRTTAVLLGITLAAQLAGCARPTPPGTPAAQAPAAGTSGGLTPGGAHQLTSKELNIYSWSEYLPQDLLDAFSKEYGVKVNADTYSSNEELLAKIMAGGTGYDIIVPSDYLVSIMTPQGLLEPLDKAQLPNLVNIDPQFLNMPYDKGNAYTIPYQWGTVGIAVNTDKVKKPITSYADLWDPAFKNQLVVPDDQREMLGLALLMLGHSKNSRDPAQLEQAKAKLLALKPNIKLYDSDSPKTQLLAGEVEAGIVWNGEGALANRENPAIQFLLPPDGCGVWYDNLAMPKNPPHKDAALAFMDFVMRPDMSALITRDFPYSNPNLAALDLIAKDKPEDYKRYEASVATNPPSNVVAKCQRVEDVGDALPLWGKMWTEVKGGQ
jgi:spermidine/putrescine-binding protein